MAKHTLLRLSFGLIACLLASVNEASPILSPVIQSELKRDYQPELDNKASLQRGAQLYFNYCAGCHSLRYDTYPNIVDYIGADHLTAAQRAKIISDTMVFDPQGDIHHTIDSAMSLSDGRRWFGAAPPDLTTMVSQKGPSWLYQFLRGFYADPKRPTGANNTIAPDTAMPNVLAELRGEVQPVVNEHGHIARFVTVKAGQLSPLEFDRKMGDLVNFLSYVAEPWRSLRIGMGVAICSLFFLLAWVCYLLFKIDRKHQE